jgi:signal peptidase I
MHPTIHAGDRIIVDKVSYKYLKRRIDRGDVVVFDPPSKAREMLGLTSKKGKSVDFLKRVVAIEGDTVLVKADQTVYVNGKHVDEPYVNREVSSDVRRGRPPTVGVTTKVGSGEVFVLGDNRANSVDSSSWGTLPISAITGRALFIYYPIDRYQVLTLDYKNVVI